MAGKRSVLCHPTDIMFGACHVTITCSTCRFHLVFRIGVGSSSGWLHVMPRQGVDSLWKELTTRLKIFTLDTQVGELVCNKLLWKSVATTLILGTANSLQKRAMQVG